MLLPYDCSHPPTSGVMPIDAIHDCIAARRGVRTNLDLHAVSLASVLMNQGCYRVIELDVMWIRSCKNCLKLRAANMSCKALMQHMTAMTP